VKKKRGNNVHINIINAVKITDTAKEAEECSMFSSERLLDLVKERRSVRLFNGEKISQENILSIIEAGIWAPTGCNNQELRFLILDKKEEIDEILGFKPFLKSASVVVLVFYDMSLPTSQKMYVKKTQAHLPYVDTGLALGNMILYAKSRGIDSCLLNLSEYHFKILKADKSLIKKIVNLVKVKLGFHKLVEGNFEFCLRKRLKIPAHFKIICGVAFGYAVRYPDVRKSHGGKKIMRESVNYHIIKKE
jgi:nitroreductase